MSRLRPLLCPLPQKFHETEPIPPTTPTKTRGSREWQCTPEIPHCNSNIQGGVCGQLEMYSKFQVSLGYKSSQNKRKQKQQKIPNQPHWGPIGYTRPSNPLRERL